MTTVAQMIEWMTTLPRDAIVSCKEEVRKGFDAYDVDVVDSDVSIECCVVHDYTSEEGRINHPIHAGKVYVYIEAA